MNKKQLITIRRALLNYEQLLSRELLEGFDPEHPCHNDWTPEHKAKELKRVSGLLDMFLNPSEKERGSNES